MSWFSRRPLVCHRWNFLCDVETLGLLVPVVSWVMCVLILVKMVCVLVAPGSHFRPGTALGARRLTCSFTQQDVLMEQSRCLLSELISVKCWVGPGKHPLSIVEHTIKWHCTWWSAFHAYYHLMRNPRGSLCTCCSGGFPLWCHLRGLLRVMGLVDSCRKTSL